MRAEVNSAVEFLSGLLGKSKVPNINVDSSRVEGFSQSLHMVMCTHYQNHWFPEKPFKGSAYRCIRIVNQKMDPLIKQAGDKCGFFSVKDLLRVLPSELTMWVDPDEVSYRIGEEGSIGVLFDASESSDNEGSSDSNSTSSQEFLPSSPARSPMRTPPVGSPVRSTNCSPALSTSSPPPAVMFQADMFQSQDHLQQQQQYQYQHQQHQVQPPTQDYFPSGCKNEWLRGGYLPSNMTNSQENHMPNFEYFSSAFVSS